MIWKYILSTEMQCSVDNFKPYNRETIKKHDKRPKCLVRKNSSCTLNTVRAAVGYIYDGVAYALSFGELLNRL